MNRNKEIKTIASLLLELKNEDEITKFFNEIFTPNELETLSKRWRILKMLADKKTQREISSALNVSLCKVTRGSKILKDKNAIVTKFLIKE